VHALCVAQTRINYFNYTHRFAEQKCHVLGELLHGWYTISPPEGGFDAVVRYTCDTGYILIGQAERHCQGDRNWSDSAPVCELEGL